MSTPKPRAYSFGRYDRISIAHSTYRYLGKIGDQHQLQLVNGTVVGDHHITVSDAQLSAFISRGDFRLDENYFSKAMADMRQREDGLSLIHLNEDQLRDLAWKHEWVERFHRARNNGASTFRPKLTHNDIAAFIVSEREDMDRWYLNKYGERRRAGRPILVTDENLDAIKQRKAFDYPSPTALRNWVRKFRRANERLHGFKPKYDKCGHRSQLPPEVEAVVSTAVARYASRTRPAKEDIVDLVEIGLEDLNGPRVKMGLPKYSVHRSTIYRRINAMNPFMVEVGRYGEDRALRRNLPVGMGINVTKPMARIEIDDWEVDLHVLVSRTEQWAKLSSKQKTQIARTRPTLTIAIDCATRCIVGFNLSEGAPSTAGSKAALRSIFVDKAELARFGRAESDWPMLGRPECVATDGGPVFKNDEFETAIQMAMGDRSLPDQDPRMRGTIEAFFRYFKRVCRLFTGQAFANVVEKGDYDAEKMASVTYEAFYRACIRFIVDVYHHRRHRGLEKATPYNKWQELTSTGMAPPLPDAQVKLAFGFRHDRVTLDKHGVLFANLSYNSKSLALLKAMQGDGTKVDLIIDPEDLGGILVVVPKRFRSEMEKLAPDDVFGDVLMVPCVERQARGVKLAQLLLGQKQVREYLAKQAEKGRVIRIAANKSLWNLARGAEDTADIPTHGLTQDKFEDVMKAFMRGAQKALGDRAVNEEPESDDLASLGQEVARSKRTRPTGEANGSSENDQPRPKGKPKKANPKRESQEAIKPQSSSINLYKGRK
jgi:putative transposase